MAREIRAYSITVPAGTSQSAPLITPTPLGLYQVAGVQIITPEGVRGSVGLQFTTSRQQMIPSNAGGWIVPHPGLTEWPLSGQITSGAWEITAYNLGNYPHTLNVRYLLDLITQAPQPLTTPILSTAEIVGATSDLVAGSIPQADQ